MTATHSFFSYHCCGRRYSLIFLPYTMCCATKAICLFIIIISQVDSKLYSLPKNLWQWAPPPPSPYHTLSVGLRQPFPPHCIGDSYYTQACAANRLVKHKYPVPLLHNFHLSSHIHKFIVFLQRAMIYIYSLTLISSMCTIKYLLHQRTSLNHAITLTHLVEARLHGIKNVLVFLGIINPTWENNNGRCSPYKFNKFITGLYRFITASLEQKTCRKKCLNVESKHICLENCFSLIIFGSSKWKSTNSLKTCLLLRRVQKGLFEFLWMPYKLQNAA